jgi:hypothetical protein
MDFNSRNQSIASRDEHLFSMKQRIQEQSRQEVSRGNLTQTDLFLIRPEMARRAVVTLKA